MGLASGTGTGWEEQASSQCSLLGAAQGELTALGSQEAFGVGTRTRLSRWQPLGLLHLGRPLWLGRPPRGELLMATLLLSCLQRSSRLRDHSVGSCEGSHDASSLFCPVRGPFPSRDGHPSSGRLPSRLWG